MAYHGKYQSPAELLRDETLSYDEKVKMLEQWRDDEKALIRASEEGMQGADEPNDLKKVKEALMGLIEAAPKR